ncbi:MAG: glycosyl transferase [Deltaproteobacteria bacterium]|nr:glycosyl transferase [Deltaproteobacteria bacterium]
MNTTVRFLISRIIKVFANSSKILCYVFHFLFPRKRFTLPKQSSPIFKNKGDTVVPKILWQTNYTDRVTLPVYINYLFNRLMSPTYAYRFMITEARADFIQSNYSKQIFESYSKLQIGAAQADFWRILVLQKYGGVYMDIDAHLVWPLGWTVKREYSELFLLRKRGGLTNYFIASKRNNVHLEKIIDALMINIRENKLTSVYRLTGPGVFNQVLSKIDVNGVSYRYTCNQGNFTNEYFQYLDKAQGKWTKAQAVIDIVKK